MRNRTRHTGEITNITRMAQSDNGNARFAFEIDGYMACTGVDSAWADNLKNYRGGVVTVILGTHYNTLTLDSIEAGDIAR